MRNQVQVSDCTNYIVHLCSGPVKQDVTSAEDLLNTMKPLLNHSLVEQFDCVYCFRITDSADTEPDVYFLDLKHG